HRTSSRPTSNKPRDPARNGAAMARHPRSSTSTPRTRRQRDAPQTPAIFRSVLSWPIIVFQVKKAKRLGSFLLSLAGSRSKPPDNHVEHRREIDAEERHPDHAAEYGDAQGDAHLGSGALGQEPRTALSRAQRCSKRCPLPWMCRAFWQAPSL